MFEFIKRLLKTPVDDVLEREYANQDDDRMQNILITSRVLLGQTLKLVSKQYGISKGQARKITFKTCRHVRAAYAGREHRLDLRYDVSNLRHMRNHYEDWKMLLEEYKKDGA